MQNESVHLKIFFLEQMMLELQRKDRKWLITMIESRLLP
jgi:hypothetical protein